MLYKTRGIVLHTINYSDKSIIAKIYTELFGLQSYMLNGIRGKSSKTKVNLFQPLSLVEMSVIHKERSSLHRISEIRNAQPFTSIPFDIAKSSVALFINEIVYKSIKEEEANPQLFNFLFNSCQMLDLQEDNCSNFHLYFMIELSRYLGFHPGEKEMKGECFFDLKEGIFCKSEPFHSFFLSPGISRSLRDIMNSGYSSLGSLTIPNDIRRELLYKLILYYELHLSSCRDISSHKILEEVLA